MSRRKWNRGKNVTHVGIACPKHGYHTNVTKNGLCGKCVQEDVRNRTTLDVGKYMPFIPWTYEDICEYPIHVTSKGQLKRLCKEHNVKAARLD